MQAVAVGKLEMQLTALLERRRGDADFLLGFADGRGERGLPWLDLAAGTVDFARAQPSLLANEQNAAVVDDKAEVGPLARLPAGPFGRWDGTRVFDLGFLGFQD